MLCFIIKSFVLTCGLLFLEFGTWNMLVVRSSFLIWSRISLVTFFFLVLFFALNFAWQFFAYLSCIICVAFEEDSVWSMKNRFMTLNLSSWKHILSFLVSTDKKSLFYEKNDHIFRINKFFWDPLPIYLEILLAMLRLVLN